MFEIYCWLIFLTSNIVNSIAIFPSWHYRGCHFKAHVTLSVPSKLPTRLAGAWYITYPSKPSEPLEVLRVKPYLPHKLLLWKNELYIYIYINCGTPKNLISQACFLPTKLRPLNHFWLSHNDFHTTSHRVSTLSRRTKIYPSWFTKPSTSKVYWNLLRQHVTTVDSGLTLIILVFHTICNRLGKISSCVKLSTCNVQLLT